jgi:hypothetical protein
LLYPLLLDAREPVRAPGACSLVELAEKTEKRLHAIQQKRQHQAVWKVERKQQEKAEEMSAVTQRRIERKHQKASASLKNVRVIPEMGTFAAQVGQDLSRVPRNELGGVHVDMDDIRNAMQFFDNSEEKM